MSHVIRSANAATVLVTHELASLGKQLHHFRDRISEDDPPDPGGSPVDKIVPVGCVPQPATWGVLYRDRAFAANSPSDTSFFFTLPLHGRRGTEQYCKRSPDGPFRFGEILASCTSGHQTRFQRHRKTALTARSSIYDA
jgi:hypothetical protein